VLAFPNSLGSSISGLAFSPDGKRLLAAGANAVVQVWDTATGIPIQSVKGHVAPLIGVSFSDDGKGLYTVDESGLVKEWAVVAAREPQTAAEARQETSGSADGRRRAVFASRIGQQPGSREVRVLDEAGREIICFKDHAESVIGAAMSPDGRYVQSADDSRVWKLWEAETGEVRLSLPYPKNAAPRDWIFRRMPFSSDGRCVAVLAAEGGVKVFRCEDGQELFSAEGNLTALNLSPDGRRLVTHVAEDGEPAFPSPNYKEMQVWDVPGRKLIAAVPGNFANALFSPDCRRVAAWSMSKSNSNFPRARTTGLKVWATDTGAELFSLDRDFGNNHHVVFNPDGTRIALTYGTFPSISPGEFTVYEIPGGKVVQRVRHQSLAVSSLAYSPDGRRLAALFASDSATGAEVKMWDTATGSEVLHLVPQSSRNSRALGFNPDGTRLFLGGRQTTETWDATPRTEK
jgi:WD40 repeat protein